MHDALIPVIGVLMASWGALFVLAPGAVPRVEEAINTPFSPGYVFALRLGWRCEHLIEHALNQPVLAHTVQWDGFVRRNPRSFGAILLAGGLATLVIGT